MKNFIHIQTRLCTKRHCERYIPVIVVVIAYIASSSAYNGSLFKKDYKYILKWNYDYKCSKFKEMGQGNNVFLNRMCQHTNCYVTKNKNKFGELKTIEKFDMIAFCGTSLFSMPSNALPKYRSAHQKFLFFSSEASQNYPQCRRGLDYDSYFNLTWSYKLSSDLQYRHMVIRDNDDNVVGPSETMKWMRFEDMEPIPDSLREQLKTKTKGVAWFVSNCQLNGRTAYADDFKAELQAFNITLDIYGNCGPYTCDNVTACDLMLQRDYYFYLSFENILDDDYVTEKVLRPLLYLTVPIVYGGANYSSYLPDHSYLDILKIGYKHLAAIVHRLMNHPDEYADYFRWRSYYSYHAPEDDPDTDNYCKLCEMLNNNDVMKGYSLKKNFSAWWQSTDDNCTENDLLMYV